MAKGILIGNHFMIGAGTFVSSDIPAFSIAVGEPCRVIGKVQISASGDVRFDYSPLQ
jgi:acetyltransferase-like isoleucine patch superfamily enzyme